MEKDFFKEKPEPLGRIVPKEQEVFIKLMVEDHNFLFRVIDLVDQNWFEPFELRHIVFIIRNMYQNGEKLTYQSVYDKIAPHYDNNDESKAVSLQIISWALGECEKGSCLGTIPIDKWKEYFINELIKRRYL